MNFAIMFISFLFVNHFLESSFKDEPYRQPRPYGLKGDAANENSTPSWIAAHPEVVGNGRRRPLQVSKGQCAQRNSPFSLPGVGARPPGATGNLQDARTWIGSPARLNQRGGKQALIGQAPAVGRRSTDCGPWYCSEDREMRCALFHLTPRPLFLNQLNFGGCQFHLAIDFLDGAGGFHFLGFLTDIVMELLAHIVVRE